MIEIVGKTKFRREKASSDKLFAFLTKSACALWRMNPKFVRSVNILVVKH
jgi:hypothetical protein